MATVPHIGCDFDIDARDYFDNTPLHIAAEISF